MSSSIDAPDWSAIPSPIDDGAASHLVGMRMPSVPLAATDVTSVDLSALPGLVVVYAYPRTGIPGIENPPGWDLIPGARGCSPQSCSFRDHFSDLKALGVNYLFGLSTQDTAYQREAAKRLQLPFPILSDKHLRLAEALDPCDSRRKDRARLLSGISARPECERCHRMAQCRCFVAGKSRLSTTKTHRLKPVPLTSLRLFFILT
jgi:peroxiredoxin